jgi:hypothetical protein
MFLGSRAQSVRRAYNLMPPVSRLTRQCGILNISRSYRPPWPVTGTDLLYQHLLVCHLAYSSTLKMEAACSNETVVSFWTARCYNPKHCILQVLWKDLQFESKPKHYIWPINTLTSCGIIKKSVLLNILQMLQIKSYSIYWYMHVLSMNSFFMVPSIATKYLYINSLYFSFIPTTCRWDIQLVIFLKGYFNTTDPLHVCNFIIISGDVICRHRFFNLQS